MSKCLICGNELVTGDIHWEQGMCNMCWNKTFNKDMEVAEVDLIDIYKDKILILEQRLAKKDKEILMLKCIIKKEHPEIERITDTNNELTIILDKIVSSDIKQIRKQVCDEIRKSINKEDFWLYGDNNKIISIFEDKFNEILDQIEQAKDSMK